MFRHPELESRTKCREIYENQASQKEMQLCESPQPNPNFNLNPNPNPSNNPRNTIFQFPFCGIMFGYRCT